MRAKAVVASLVNLSLAIVSTTFVLLALTSNDWATQEYYEASAPGTGSSTSWIHPICVAHRSPFYRCGYPSVDFNAARNASACSIPDCQFYKPYGRNDTSCRLASEYGKEDASVAHGLIGTGQECQQVHLAGNLQIASSVFITVGLVILLTLTLGNVINGVFSATAKSNEEEATPATEEGAESSKARPSHRSHGRRTHLLRGTPHLVLVLLFMLYAGAFLQILAQFFGVLGLTVTATGTGGSTDDQKAYGASLWMIGKALSAYTTTAWVFAIATAAMTAFLYRTPRFTKLV